MKNKTRNSFMHSQSFIVKWVILLCMTIVIAVKGQNCLKMKVLDYTSSNSYRDICVECLQNQSNPQIFYVLSYDFQSCIPTSNKLDAHNNCLQFNKNGDCQQMRGKNEAIIDEKGEISLIQNDQVQLVNCAIKNSQNNACTFPVFPYRLNLDTNAITYDNAKFCAIFQNNACVQYHYGFINWNNSQYSALLYNFINYDKLTQFNFSSGQKFSCVDGYTYELNGCKSNIPITIPNCSSVVNEACFMCKSGYALSNDSKSCIQFDSCSRAQIIRGIPVCLECYSNLETFNGMCIKRITQKKVSGIFCKYPQMNEYCLDKNPQSLFFCGVQTSQGECVYCTDHDKSFFNNNTKSCEKRVYSLLCVNKHPLSDQCLTPYCKSGYQFTRQKNYTQKLVYYDPNEILMGNNQLVQVVVTQNECTAATVINNCQVYDEKTNSQNCLKCNDGYYLYLTNGLFKCSNNLSDFPNILNCSVFTNDRKECLQCSAGYFLNYSTNKCQLGESPDNCISYIFNDAGQKVCNACKSGFDKFVNGIKCFDRTYCKLEKSICVACDQLPNKFITQVDNICVLTKIPCLVSVNGVCQSCHPYYILQNGNCVLYTQFEEKFQSCGQVVSNNGQIQCSNCRDNYYFMQPEDNTCQIYHPKNASNLKKCPTDSGIVNSVCTTCIDKNCSSCIDSQCLQCKKGYFLNTLLKCVYKCPNGDIKDNESDCCFIPNCNQCTPNNQACVVCNANYFVKNNLCYQECPNKYVKDNACVDTCEKPNFYQTETVIVNSISKQQKFCKQTCEGFTHTSDSQLCTDVCNNNEKIYSNTKICHYCDVQSCNYCSLNNKDNCEKCSNEYLSQTQQNNNVSCIYICKNQQIVNDKSLCSNCAVSNCSKCITNRTDQCDTCMNNYTKTNNICVCGSGFYEIANPAKQCLPCTSYCIKCTSDNNCFECDSNYVLFNNQCVNSCPDGYFKKNVNNIQTCVKCAENCDKCNSDSFCDSCSSGYEHTQYETSLNNFQWKCLYKCQDGSKKFNSNECSTCNTNNCYHCISDNGNQCQQCALGYYNKSSICMVQCSNGEYKESVDLCCKDKNCSSCKLDQTNFCLTCKAGFFLDQNNQCLQYCPNQFLVEPSQNNPIQSCVNECPSGYDYYREQSIFFNNQNTTQKICQNVCNNYTHTTIPKLCSIQCNPNEIIYQNSKICHICDVQKCTQCQLTNSNSCEKCENEYLQYTEQNNNISCIYICKNEQIVTDKTQCSTCQVSNCQTCQSNNIDQCDTCMTNYTKINNQCVCGSGFYEIANPAKQCQSCSDGCTKCTSGNTCLECDNNHALYNNQCVISCPDNFFKKNINNLNICSACIDNCSQCIDQNTCDSCSNGYEYTQFETAPNNFQWKCLYKCQDGSKKFNSYECSTCTQQNCHDCQGNTNLCQQCALGYQVYNSVCMVQCSNGEFKQDKNQCCTDKNCQSCQVNQTNVCITCKTGYFIEKQSQLCLQQCDGQYIVEATSQSSPQQCVNQCPQGYDYYREQNIVVNNINVLQQICQKTCNNYTHYSIPKLCSEKCNDNEKIYSNTKICQICQIQNCSYCPINNMNSCEKCENEYFQYTLQNNNISCIYICKNQLIVNDKSLCPKCQVSNCQTCINNSMDQCDQCMMNYTKTNNQCICGSGFYEIAKPAKQCLPCQSGCTKCNSNNACQECDNNHILFNTQCIASCPDGYFKKSVNNVNTCVPCIENCNKCNSDTVCDTCSQGYEYTQYEVSENKFQYKCLFRCQNGSLKFSSSECQKCLAFNCIHCENNTNNCIQCGLNYFAKDNICRVKCPNGRFQENCCDDYYCQNCSTSSSKLCLSCYNDYFLNQQGKCIKECPNQYLIDNGTIGQCVNECPGNYPYYREQTIFVSNQSKTQKVCFQECSGYTHQATPKLCTNKCLAGQNTDESTRICYNCSAQNCMQCTTPTINTCLKCIYPYFLQNNSTCGYICKNQEIVTDKSKCSSCEIENCVSCSISACSSCMQNYLPRNNKCECPTNDGYTEVKDPAKRCIPCNVSNCSVCSSQNTCDECQYSYNLHQGKCTYFCPQGYFSKDKRCVKCSANCTNCSSENYCITCDSGYQLSKFNVDYNTEGQQCLFICQNGSKKENSSQCTTCKDYYCTLCSQDNSKCINCQQGFVINKQNGFCVPKDNVYKCSKTKNCTSCDQDGSCQQCIDGYILYQNKCMYQCYDNILATSSSQCQNIQYCGKSTLCSECDTKYLNICKSCKQGSYLYHGQCLTECPKQHYKSIGTCEKCNEKCDECNGPSDMDCLSCVSTSSNTSSKCSCPYPNYFSLYSSTPCVSSCPVYSTLTGDFCERDCSLGLYPTINQGKKICQKVLDNTSSFCLDHLKNIPRVIEFNFRNTTLYDYTFVATLNQTPANCYTFEFGDVYYPPKLVESVYMDSVSYTTTISKTNFNSMISCTETDCTIYLKLFFLNQLKYSFKMTFNINYDYLISLNQEVQDGVTQIDGYCPTCQIPKEKTVQSKVNVYCSYDQLCTSNQVKTNFNSTIRVEHTTTDWRFSNKKFVPHQVYVQYIDKKTNTNNYLYLKNYQFDVSTPGQIVYFIPTFGLPNGNLTIVSRVVNPFGNSRMLLNTNTDEFESSVYPKHTLQLELEPDYSKQTGFKSHHVLMFAIILGYFIMKKIMNKNNKDKNLYQNQPKYDDESQMLSDSDEKQEQQKYDNIIQS